LAFIRGLRSSTERSRRPWSRADAGFVQGAAGEGDILGDLEVEHAHTEEVRASFEGDKRLTSSFPSLPRGMGSTEPLSGVEAGWGSA
jgi:hypothetical protein